MLKYCTLCLLPETKPDLSFDDEGVCSACNSYKNRATIDWEQREREFVNTLNRYKDDGRNSWDCIVPVSGGKDSTVQVMKILELGFNPLCVTATTCHLSEVGRKNIINIRELGADAVEFSPNPVIRRKLNRIGLENVGDISWPEHLGIFTIPVRAAVQFNVPLIVWGENSQNEYGGPATAMENNSLDRSWLEEFGGLLGMRVSDLPEFSGIEEKDLIAYTYPSDVELKRVGVTGLFLGYFFPWDGLSNAILAQASGFTSFGSAIEGSMVDYENLDNHQTGIHDYFKYLKYGFGRATDIASLHIRRGRLSREQGLSIVKQRDGAFPETCLGLPLVEILKPLGLSVNDFNLICDQFTNRSIFKSKSDGTIVRNLDGSPIKINYDN
jgi:N-acetyl sugar amidotransferase